MCGKVSYWCILGCIFIWWCPVFDNPSETYVQTKDLKGISLDLLVPGMMVNARIQSTLENGIMLSFLTYFSGTVCVLCLLVLKLSVKHYLFFVSYARSFCGVRLIFFTCKMHFLHLTGRSSMTRIKRYGNLDYFCLLVVEMEIVIE